KVFEDAGYATLTPGWPDDPATVEEANASPEVFAKKSIGEVAEHFEQIIRGLKKKPALIGHSFGGLIAQILAGRGLAAVTVAIDPAPDRKSTRLNSSHVAISYAVFCLKKKTTT